MTKKRFTRKEFAIYERGNPICMTLRDVDKRLNELWDENMELKERNQRQAERLDRLYGLIEAEDWRALSDILDDFKRCEEQIQQEECTYAER